jgi:basic amino acid/polyamine antiporter, APA family
MTFNNKIGFKATLSLVIGNIIGVGIFTTTGYVANILDSSLLIMLLWILGGIYAISGAVVYGILAKEYPLSGGDFQYLKSEIHPVLGYMFGWSALTVTYTGSIAALAIGAAYYFNSVFDMGILNETIFNLSIFDWQIIFNDEKIIAILLVLIFSWINYRGINISANYQTVLTALIIIFIVIFSISGILSVKDSVLFSVGESVSTSINNFLTAFIAVIFTFIGWTSAVYIAEEIEEPKQLIPKSLIYGVVIVTLLYLLINFLYLYALPIIELKNSINVATLVSENLWGTGIATAVSFFIFIAVLSTLNSSILSGSRIYMSMSREGYLFGKFADNHKKYFTPYKAIIIQAVWTIILIFSGSFNQLLSFIVFVIMIFSTLAGIISIKIIIRNKSIKQYLLIFSVIYTLICLLVGLNTFATQFMESIIGLGLIFISFLFYLIEKKPNVKKSPQT